MRTDGLEQLVRAAQVRFEEVVVPMTARRQRGGEVTDDGDAVRRARERRAIGQPTHDHLGARRLQVGAARVVGQDQRPDRRSVREVRANDVATDAPGGAGDEDGHRAPSAR